MTYKLSLIIYVLIFLLIALACRPSLAAKLQPTATATHLPESITKPPKTNVTVTAALHPSPPTAAGSMPDASKIVFLADYQLNTLDVNTGQVSPIEHDYQAVLEELGVHGSFYCPQWSPNRRQIALSIYGGMSSGLYLLQADGSRPRLLGHQRLPHGEGSPDIPIWSPDGRTIKMAGVWLDAAVQQSVEEPWRGGWVWSPGAEVTPQSTSPDQKSVQLIHTEANEWGPVWSPDGQRLAFLSDRAGQADIYLADANDMKGRRLTNTPAEERILAWSPDGVQILYIVVKRNISNSISFDIHVIKSDGSEQKLLAEGVTLRTGLSECHYPVWSPDGRYIAFMDNRTIFVIEADGANPRKLLTWPGGYVEFDW